MASQGHLGFTLVSVLLVISILQVSLSTTLTTSSDHCRFPATMYIHPSRRIRNERDLKWYIYSPNQSAKRRHEIQMIDFDEDRISIHYGQRPFNPEAEADVTYACIEQLNDDRYLVTKQQRYKEHMYQCVQFVLRSETVVQWRLSAESEVHSSLLCDDHSLKLQEAPLVYYHLPGHWNAGRTRQREYVPCPLEGGYFISQWGNSTHDSTCRTNIPPTKLESECAKGDGIRYQVGSGNCLQPFADGKVSQLFCIGTWENEEFTFSVVVAKGVPHAVSCMRFPTIHGHSFTAHIFTNGVCRMGYNVQNDASRHSITMSPHIETSLCGDDTQACVMTPNLRCTETISKACRETCNSCPYPITWGSIKIARQFHGRWVLYRGELSHEVAIDDKFVEIPTIGKFKIFTNNKCPDTGADVTSGKKRYVFYTDFENGCSPRLTAMELFKRSDAVMGLRISESVPINYTVSLAEDGLDYVITDWDDWCNSLHFTTGPIESDDSFRTDSSGWYNLIHKDRTSLPYACNFPESLQRMQLALTTGVNCTVEVVQDKTIGFSIKLDACKSGVSDAYHSPSNEPIGSPISVTCLASFGGRVRGMQYFITRTTSNARISGQKFMCWSLDLDALRGLLLPVSDCDDNSALQVARQAQRSQFGRLSAMSNYMPAANAATPNPKAGAAIDGSNRVNPANINKPKFTNIFMLLLLLALIKL